VIRCRVGRGATCCCPACGGNHDVYHGAWGEGWRFQRWRRDFGGYCRQGRSGHYVPPAEGGVAAAESSKLSWTSVFVAFMGIMVSCVSVRRPTSPTVWRRVPLLQMCLPKSRDFGRSTLTPSGRSRLRIARAASWRRRWLSVFWVRPHTRGCPSRCFRSRTVSPTVAKWFVPDARGTMDSVYRFGPL
jgi:hypothetical protein